MGRTIAEYEKKTWGVSIPLSGQLVCNITSSKTQQIEVSIPLSGQLVCNQERILRDNKFSDGLNPLIGSIGL